ncbi:MAG: rhomboid family intramembrane serine protease [Phycisphaeraceae bacterium]|nr:rhomboid family intramembrane serine protease [Phycisphaeraceae bacterium]
MAWQDRTYHSQGSVGAGFIPRLRGRSVVFWLLVINVAVFAGDAVLSRMGVAGAIAEHGPLYSVGYFSAQTVIQQGQIWRLITFQFLHADLGHIFFNMLGLFFFGPMVEGYLGSRRFLAFYLLCGVAGAAAYVGLWLAGILITQAWIPLIGASAGLFGILLAGAKIAPDMKVMLLFPPIPLSLKAMAWIYVGIGVYMVVTAGGNAGGEAAHLGGAALGFLLIRKPGLLNFAGGRGLTTNLGPSARRGRLRRMLEDHRHKSLQREEAEVDRILDKVHKQGLHNLTEREKRILQRATKRQRLSS